ncbi:MAG: SprB repeat-containing protein [Saprospiraceae bacterium]
MYPITVTDANGCEASTSYTVGEEGAITLNPSGTDVDDACNGTNSGSITVTVSGGVLPYIFNWDDIGVGASTRTNLAPGVYPITVTDANGCEASTSYTVGEEGAITLNPSGTDVDDACNGTNSGSITVTVSGGVLPYIFNWDDIGVGASTRTNSAPGVYPQR